MLGQSHALGDVLLEYQPVAATLSEAFDLLPQVRPQGSVLDPLQEDVQLASDHAGWVTGRLRSGSRGGARPGSKRPGAAPATIESMPKSPLFSTYRQGENRVTASLMAVFERIDLSNLERILASASEDSALQLFSFENQVHGGSSPSVPDARISASFALWFETKTAPGQVRLDQLRGHLKHLGDGHGYERLFLLTPDADEPEAVATIDDARLKWLSFKALSQAIDDLLGDDRELVSEKEELLLRELQALFEVDNLLGDPRGVVVVPAGNAYREYLELSAYICQPRRAFKPVERMAFYCRGKIEREIPLVRHVVDEVEFTPGRRRTPAVIP